MSDITRSGLTRKQERGHIPTSVPGPGNSFREEVYSPDRWKKLVESGIVPESMLVRKAGKPAKTTKKASSKKKKPLS